MTTLTHDNRSMESTLGVALPATSGALLQRLAQAWQQRRAVAAARRRTKRSDQQLWNAALADPRIMADISRAQQAQPGEVRKQRMMRTF